MTNSTIAGARLHITAEYLSEDEPLELLRFQYVKSSRNRISAPGEGRHMRMPTLNEIESQTDEADGNRLEKPCKIIGQKSDKAKCKSLQQELLKREGKVLQNSTPQFDPGPRLQVPSAEAFAENAGSLRQRSAGTFCLVSS
jgi:hypothetical protein